MNNLAVSLFLELIRSAIWSNKAEESLFTDVDETIWKEVVSFAESQSVSALLYDGIMTLPKSVWPDKRIVYKLFMQTQFIEKRNRNFNEELKNIANEEIKYFHSLNVKIVQYRPKRSSKQIMENN